MVKGMDGFPRWRLPLLVADVPKCSSGQEESSQTDGNPMIGRGICKTAPVKGRLRGARR